MRGIQEMSVSGGPRREKGCSSITRKGNESRNLELESSNIPTRPNTSDRGNANLSRQVKNSLDKTF